MKNINNKRHDGGFFAEITPKSRLLTLQKNSIKDTSVNQLS